MILTDVEIEMAAERLARTSLQKDWMFIPERERAGFRTVVKNLAAELNVVRSPAAVHVFMTWMGERELINE